MEAANQNNGNFCSFGTQSRAAVPKSFTKLEHSPTGSLHPPLLHTRRFGTNNLYPVLRIPE
ncbi:hypothetical protein VFPPC_16448 [Pochonia chlamydosporia 170]|uniref:Uncharacterized protein n=1 Tax=Pochonia chlamydosporia 170 TaxID=1380566 RepID=A0A179FD91_METCM|nr:hypothetical protein VFPPC_16448 [Pochonia chlamydosporia 170]OAQ63270.1 hypothetical protein VFPPC_16448 [Pochonia chlamydosporia 170]